MRTFAGKGDFLDGPVSDVVEPLVFLVKKSVQPQNGCVGDRHIPELVELVADSVGNGDLVERKLDEVAEVRGEQGRQPLVETTG